MHNILVLCIGNICRSPMAEGLLRQATPGKTLRSAGLGALIGQPAEPFSVQVMSEHSFDISAHRTQSISSRLVSEADLILVMDLEQKKYVESHYIGSKGKVFRLGEFAKVDIADPYKGGLKSFQAANRVIDEGVKVFTERLIQMNWSGYVKSGNQTQIPYPHEHYINDTNLLK